MVELFNMPADDYKRFLGFLRKYQCHMPFQQFRSAATSRARRGLPAPAPVAWPHGLPPPDVQAASLGSVIGATSGACAPASVAREGLRDREPVGQSEAVVSMV